MPSTRTEPSPLEASTAALNVSGMRIVMRPSPVVILQSVFARLPCDASMLTDPSPVRTVSFDPACRLIDSNRAVACVRLDLALHV
jgi:hypothetical protein